MLPLNAPSVNPEATPVPPSPANYSRIKELRHAYVDELATASQIREMGRLIINNRDDLQHFLEVLLVDESLVRLHQENETDVTAD